MTQLDRLARYVDDLSLQTIPPPVLARVKTCLLYTLCMTVIAHDETDVPVKAARAITPPGEGARVLVSGESRSAADAAFNLEYVTRLRDTVAKGRGPLRSVELQTGVAATGESSDLPSGTTVHGVPGGPPSRR